MQEEETSSPSHSKIKEMRRIAERTEAPSDKSELISYLNDRIKQAEVTSFLARTPSMTHNNCWNARSRNAKRSV